MKYAFILVLKATALLASTEGSSPLHAILNKILSSEKRDFTARNLPVGEKQEGAQIFPDDDAENVRLVIDRGISREDFRPNDTSNRGENRLHLEQLPPHQVEELIDQSKDYIKGLINVLKLDYKRYLGSRVTKRSAPENDIYLIRGRKSTHIGTRVTKRNSKGIKRIINLPLNQLHYMKRFNVFLRPVKRDEFGGHWKRLSDVGNPLVRNQDEFGSRGTRRFGTRVTKRRNLGARITRSHSYGARVTKKNNIGARVTKKSASEYRMAKRPNYGTRVTKRGDYDMGFVAPENFGTRVTKKSRSIDCSKLVNVEIFDLRPEDLLAIRRCLDGDSTDSRSSRKLPNIISGLIIDGSLLKERGLELPQIKKLQKRSIIQSHADDESDSPEYFDDIKRTNLDFEGSRNQKNNVDT